MTVSVSDFINVKERAIELGCNVPTELALLPRNFADAKSKDELVHEDTASTVRVLLRQANIEETRLEKEGDRFPEALEEAFEWIAPIIFVAAALYSENPHVISVALGVISNYLTEWFKGISSGGRVKLDVVLETRQGTCKRIHYDGAVEGLRDLPQIISGLNHDE